MDVSWVISLILGLPVAVLAMLKIIDWGKKRRTSNQVVQHEESSEIDLIINVEGQPPSAEPADQGLAPLIHQTELTADVERRDAEKLHPYEAAHRC